MKKKLLIFILVLVMALIFVPCIASAANTTEFAGGSGTAKDPYLISTTAQLDNVRKYLDAHFKLTCDIVFTDADFAKGGAFYNKGAGWAPIGTSSGSAFTGTFDGNGFSAKNLYVNKSGSSEIYGGLFGYNEGTIQNLGMVAGNISATGENGFSQAGGIAGYNLGTIINCHSTGTVSAKANKTYAGGIVGLNVGSIKNSYNTGTVSATAEGSNGWAYAGGIAGRNYYSIIKNCYNTGAVSATAEGNNSSDYTGGITGCNEGSLTNCYYLNAISVGAETGDDTATQCTAEEMQQQSTFVGFDFDKIWYISADKEYKYPVIDAVHTYEMITTKATLSKNGSIVEKCAVCGRVKSRNIIPRPETIVLSATSYTYDGLVKTPTVILQSSTGKIFTKNVDYTATYASGRKNVGTYKVTINGIGNYAFTKTLTFKIDPAKVSNCSLKLSTTAYTYNGKVKTPTVTVTGLTGSKLTKGTSYTVSYESGRVNVGTYTVKVTMKGNYTGTRTLSFKINPAKASNCAMKLSTYTYTYNGKVKTPSVKITSPTGSTLTKGTHYTVTYASGRRNAGTYKVTVTMKGNYTGTKTQSFKINPAKASNCAMKLSTYTYTYNGKVKTPSVKIVSPTGSTLTKGTSYTVTYSGGRINVGTYTVKVTMKGNYTGTKTQTFKIKPIKASNCAMKLSTYTYTYNGKVKAPSVKIVSPTGATLTKGTSYTVSYESGRINVGTYTVKVTMKGNYTGTKTQTFKINPAKASNCIMYVTTTNYAYDGKVKTPGVAVISPMRRFLTEGTNYTVTYASGRRNAGTYTVKVTMMGNYTGTRTLSFKIKPVKAAYCGMVLSIDNDTYDGRVKNPTLTVTSPQGKTLTEGTSYTVTYASGRKNVGTYTAKVTMKGNYTGTRTLSFKIYPPTIGLYDYSVDSKSITVKVEPQKSSQVTGYQILYAPWQPFNTWQPYDPATATTKTFSGFNTTSYTIKGLRSQTSYYVRFRTYKIVDDVKYYSHWTSYKLRTQ